jgi:hypothetical protein
MCLCAQFSDLELLRGDITKRIRDSKQLKKSLSVICKHLDGEHKLYHCAACGQLWQGSRAWNWGNYEYLFKVPSVEPLDWASEVYAQPDELLIFTAVMHDFLTRGAFTDTVSICRAEGCSKKAVSGAVHCLGHHLSNLQILGTMPPYPTGRWFGPYARENIVPNF